MSGTRLATTRCSWLGRKQRAASVTLFSRADSVAKSAPSIVSSIASSVSVIAWVPSLQAGHCPHDSTYKKRDTAAASSAGSVRSSNTMNPALPRPDPIDSIAS